MRQVRELSDSERLELEQVHRSGQSHRERVRAHAVLLSSQGFDRDTLATIFFTDRNTISDWLTRFEQGGVAALRDAPKSGRPSKLTVPAQSIVRQALQDPTPDFKPQLLERLKKGALR